MERIKKIWLIETAIVALVPCALVMLFNYFMDPLWCFDVSNRYNRYQVEFDERKQKTDYITYRDFSYRGLLIGSSRATFASQNSFRGLRVYNYSVNSLKVNELSCLTNYAKKRNGRDFDYIFLGLDFEVARPGVVKAAAPADTLQDIREAGSPLYRIKSLLSIDTARQSWAVMKNNFKPPWRYYDRDNVQHAKKFSRKETEETFDLHIRSYTKNTSYFRTLGYTGLYRSHLEAYKRENPRSAIVVFIPPMSLPLMQLIVEYGNLDDYFRWLSDVVDVFGTVYLFAYPNRVTTDYMENFFDPIHAYPHIGAMMVDAIYNNRITGDSDFGMVLTRANFPVKRVYLEKIMRDVHDPVYGPLLKKAGPVRHQ